MDKWCPAMCLITGLWSALSGTKAHICHYRHHQCSEIDKCQVCQEPKQFSTSHLLHGRKRLDQCNLRCCMWWLSWIWKHFVLVIQIFQAVCDEDLGQFLFFPGLGKFFMLIFQLIFWQFTSPHHWEGLLLPRFLWVDSEWISLRPINLGVIRRDSKQKWYFK